MKRDFLTELFKKGNIEAGKDIIDAIMAKHGEDIEAGKTALEKAENELAIEKASAKSLGEQLAQRDKDIEALKTQAGNSEELQKKLNELQTQYTQAGADHKTALETQAKEMQAKLDGQARDHAMEKYFTGVTFTSDLAKNAAMSEFKTKEFKLDNGSFLGADDWLKQLKENNPTAFKNEADDKQKKPEQQLPKFTKPIGGNESGKDKPAFFANGGFNFVRQPPKE